MPITITKYKLRAGSPMEDENRNFILQSFGVDKSLVDNHAATTVLLTSCDMWGLGGDYVSASYQRLPYLTEDCEQAFSGQEEHRPEFVDESVLDELTT
jgi:hypothetical protein